MSMQHQYAVKTTWQDKTGEGTKDYRTYSRNHALNAKGKPIIEASSDPLFRGDFTLIDDGPIRRGKPTAEGSGSDEVDLIGQPNEIVVGIFDCDIFGKTAPRGKARLKLVVADLLIARQTLFARPAAGDKRNRDPITQFEI